MTLEAITGKTFRETVLANPKPVLLLYHSKWNSSCSGQLEVFQSLAPTLGAGRGGSGPDKRGSGSGIGRLVSHH